MGNELIKDEADYRYQVRRENKLFVESEGYGRATPKHGTLIEQAINVCSENKKFDERGVSRLICGYTQNGKPAVIAASHDCLAIVREIETGVLTFKSVLVKSTEDQLTIESDDEDHYKISINTSSYWAVYGRGQELAASLMMFLFRINAGIVKQQKFSGYISDDMRVAQQRDISNEARVVTSGSTDSIGIVADAFKLLQFSDGKVGFDADENAPRYQLDDIQVDRNSREVSDTGSFAGYVFKRIWFGRSADIVRSIDKNRSHVEDVSTIIVELTDSKGFNSRFRSELTESNAPQFDNFKFVHIDEQAQQKQDSVKESLTLNDIELLKQLSTLADAGVITSEEFTAKKQQILGI